MSVIFLPLFFPPSGCVLQVGTLWRFVAFADPLVDVALSRDLDSYLLPREEAAVREWLTSSLAFHLMRDHPSHNGFILAGERKGKEGGRRIGEE